MCHHLYALFMVSYSNAQLLQPNTYGHAQIVLIVSVILTVSGNKNSDIYNEGPSSYGRSNPLRIVPFLGQVLMMMC